MYNEIRFRFQRGGPLDSFQGSARLFVSRACDGLSMPAFFGKREDGKERQERYGDDRKGEGFAAPPWVAFSRGPDLIRITGLGPQGCALVREAAPIVQAALIRHVKAPVGFEFLEGECSLEFQGGRLTPYVIPNLVVAKKPETMRRFLQKGTGCWASLRDVRERVAEVITRGLLAQARFLDLALGGDSGGLENILRRHDSVPMDLADGRPAPIEIKPGLLASGFRGLLVGLPFKLVGPWSAGYLRTDGYGRLHFAGGRA